MNRAERRRLKKEGVTVPAEPMINLRRSDLIHIKKKPPCKPLKRHLP